MKRKQRQHPTEGRALMIVFIFTDCQGLLQVCLGLVFLSLLFSACVCFGVCSCVCWGRGVRVCVCVCVGITSSESTLPLGRI